MEMSREVVTDDLAGALARGGEAGRLIAEVDWSATPIGPMSTWPARLRAAVSTMVQCPFPMLVVWGPEYTMIYNDAYRPVLGRTKHPAYGESLREVFIEGFDEHISWRMRYPLEDGVAFASDDEVLPIDRDDRLEESHFAFSYSPLDDDQGAVAGVLVACIETTAEVLDRRRLEMLSVLTSALAACDRPDAVWSCVADALSGFIDTPALLVVDDDDRVVASAGLEEPPSPGDWVTVAEPLESWVQLGLDAVTHPDWLEPSRTVRVLSFEGARLVIGLHPGATLDAGYERFLSLLADAVAAGAARARRARELAEHLASLERLDRARDALLSDVSHELRTPLALISGTVEELRTADDLDESERAGLLDLASRNVDRLRRLVDSLLAYGQLEAGHLEPRPVPTDMVALTAAACESFAREFRQAGIEFIVRLDDVGGRVWVDPSMWETMLLNLLSNAYKFTLEGSVSVDLRSTGSELVLEVADTGIGIAPEQRIEVFERFRRDRSAAGRTDEGAGIGLALVHAVVERHGGHIALDSEVGVGTTMTVTVPIVRPDGPQRAGGHTDVGTGDAAVPNAASGPGSGEPAGPGTTADPAGAGTGVRTAGRSVLVVDDSEDLLALLQLALSRHWQVEVAHNGRRALELLEGDDGTSVDLVITDAMMPVLDGPGLIRQIRSRSDLAEVPILLLTGMGGDVPGGVDDLIDASMGKPFQLAELVALVDDLLSR